MCHAEVRTENICNENLILQICLFRSLEYNVFFPSIMEQVYEVSSSMKWSLFTPDPEIFTTEQMFYLEKSIAQFLNDVLTSSPEFEDQEVYMTNYHAKDQDIDGEDVRTSINAEVSVVYSGKEKEGFTAELSKVFTAEKAERLLEILVRSGYFQDSTTSSMLEFEEIRTIMIANTSDDTILFIVLTSLVGLLVLFSFGILLNSLSCCNRNSDSDIQNGGIKPSNTFESSPGNSPGNLGARRNVIPDDVDTAYAITPVRGVLSKTHSSETPASQMSNDSEYSGAMSIGSRNPLGIMRLNTLNRLSDEQPSGKTPQAMYQIPLHESDEEEGVDE